ncbi:glycosyltransferase [Paenibacillus sp. MBLB2552]|uniref:Glycosyltransferase n=1 Tax=Paenibacillus mellifer TaxID=2937794 RepID=A0A9X1Y8H4_9BACL|nr:glycosyltransferase [Paenibacillus mellifer]MCK8489217.1 glycosyltransferase [Paenibacillus mellifer]
MKKIGIFLGFQPGSNLTTEGIGRLLAFILKESKKDSITIFCPKWLRYSVEKLFEDNKISLDRFEIVSTQNVPFGVKVKNYLKERRTPKVQFSKISHLVNKLKRKFIDFVRNIISNFFSTTSVWLLLIKTILLVVSSVVLSPILVLSGIIWFIFSFLSFIGRRIRKTTPVNRIAKKLKQSIDIIKGSVYQLVIDNELNRVVGIINRRKDIRVCFIPSMIWPQIVNLNCKKVLAAPDIVFYDFPTQFIGVGEVHDRIRKSIAVADHLICYSEQVKNDHLVNKCGVDPSKVTVIKHANIDMYEHIKVSKSLQRYYSEKQNAKQIINRYVTSTLSTGHVLYNVDIENLDYVIYSSQFRPHKNIPNLIKSIRILNIDLQTNIKLIVTGDFRFDRELVDFCRDNHLDNDIFIISNMSSELLAAFNCFAKVAVNPTLFEGGFPFTFSEAYSVGTPSVMSSIPAVIEEIEDVQLQRKMLFDPYDPYSIATKIEWAFQNSEELFFCQSSLYQKFSKRNWEQVASEYNKVFNKLM